MKAPLSFMFFTTPCTAGNVVITDGNVVIKSTGTNMSLFCFKTFNGKQSKIKCIFLKLVYKAFNDPL